ncbi:MAG: hypothetical protein ABW168_29650 [Sedimenticola sp.]
MKASAGICYGSRKGERYGSFSRAVGKQWGGIHITQQIQTYLQEDAMVQVDLPGAFAIGHIFAALSKDYLK